MVGFLIGTMDIVASFVLNDGRLAEFERLRFMHLPADSESPLARCLFMTRNTMYVEGKLLSSEELVQLEPYDVFRAFGIIQGQILKPFPHKGDEACSKYLKNIGSRKGQ